MHFELGVGQSLSGHRVLGDASRVGLGLGAITFVVGGTASLMGGGDVLLAVAGILIGVGLGRAAYTARDHIDEEAFIRLEPCPCCLHATLWPSEETRACRLCDWEAQPGDVLSDSAAELPRRNFQEHGTHYPPDEAAKWGATPPSSEERQAKLEVVEALGRLYPSQPAESNVAYEVLVSVDRALTELVRNPDGRAF